MPFSSDPFAKRESLWPYAVGMTLTGLLSLYALAQVLSYRLPAAAPQEKLEICEIFPLEQPNIKAMAPVRTEQKAPLRMSKPQSHATASASSDAGASSAAPAQINVAELLEGLDSAALLVAQNGGSRSFLEHGGNVAQVRADANTAPQKFAANSSLTDVGGHRARSRARGEVRAHELAASLKLGRGSGAGNMASGSAFSSGPANVLVRRFGGSMNAEKNSATNVGMGTGFDKDGGEPGLSIHDLINWMRAHPGVIPKLVQYDMEHKSGDLASATTFTRNGKSYEMFLSCNASNLLLRICLIEGNKFTMLKDNGIKETSNFLAIGEVVRSGVTIQSLITSRQAPGERAQNFYNIFWSWWEEQRSR